MRIAVSTIAFQGLTIEEIIRIARAENWTIEFSSGLAYRPDLKDLYLNAEIDRLPHNYFPPPEKPFVLNLASINDEIRERSVQHCMQGLELAKASKASFYSAHAGFCGDPKPSELGNRIEFKSNFDRGLFWSRFTQSIKEVLTQAETLEVDFLIENNVCASVNLTSLGENPLLCSDPDEIEKLILDIGNPRLGILLDTAHLKVSCRTLKFDLLAAVDRARPFVVAIHHSDNDAIIDNNQALNKSYWFFQQQSEFDNVMHILEVKNIDPDTIAAQISLLAKKRA
jgi:sugar phosphate isomerase/epimerase